MMNIFQKRDPSILLKIFLGIVFLGGGLYRIFHWHQATLEFYSLTPQLAYPLLYITVILEVLGGLLLIFNKKNHLTIPAFIIFLSLALIIMILTFWQSLAATFTELFFFRATATDVFLHITYLVILIYLFFRLKEGDSK